MSAIDKFSSFEKVMIGIDTGVNTGFAMAIDRGDGGELVQVNCLTITQAMARVQEIIEQYGNPNVCLYIEDARLRTWFTGGREKAQGVGSIKRDAQIWETWCIENKINYLMIHPKANTTKVKATTFQKITKWLGRTNEHSRDAAMLVHKRFAKFGGYRFEPFVNPNIHYFACFGDCSNSHFCFFYWCSKRLE